MKLKFMPLDYSYFDFNGKNVILIIGRNEKGKRIGVIDDYEPNFWVVLKDKISDKKIKEIEKKIGVIEVEKASRKTRVLSTRVCDKKFLGKNVKAIQVFVENHKDLQAVASEIDFPEVDKRREYDISIISKYIMEKKVNPMEWQDVETNSLDISEEYGGFGKDLDVEMLVKVEKISKSDEQPEFKPKVLTFDIETDEFELGKGNVLMISLYGENFEKVLTWKKCSKKQDFVECFKDEAEMLEKFVEYVKEYDADILSGYFSDGFDLPYLKSVASRNKVRLSLGIDGSQPNFTRGRIPSGKIFGMVHLDVFRFIENVYSQYLQSETISLNDVASELLGENKKDFDFHKIPNMKDADWRDFFEYNLHDSRITYELFQRLWPDILEFAKIMHEPLFEVTRSSMSGHVEDYLLHNLDRFNEIAEKRPVHEEIGKRRAFGKYEGALVFEPKPGLYEDIGVFDFTSMHASIIVSFNISLSTISKKKKKGFYETPEFELNKEKNKYYFSNEVGFFPALLGEVVEKRKKYKQEYNENKNPLTKARSNAYKLLANASYGYLGFFGARYYCREAAASTLAWVRQFTTDSMKKIKDKDYNIIFSDTDSIGFELNGKSEKQTIEFLKEINSDLPGIMELELEGFFKRGLFVSKRTTKTGAKKKYALMGLDGSLKIRGFESVRRDWCKLAKRLQGKVIRDILEKGNEKKAMEFIDKVIGEVIDGKVEKKDLIIRTQLRKPISEYIALAPHVMAAKRMEEMGIPISQGNLVEYFISETPGNKKLVRDKVKLPEEEGKYDVEYYLDHQVVPAVENILDVFGINVKEELIEGNKQTSLGEF
jgi:DNA polymerase, archaea type